jgi:hypothetical protein
MNAIAVGLDADRDAIGAFVDALFRYAEIGTVASLRGFADQQRGPPYAIEAHRLRDERAPLVIQAADLATRCARAFQPVVFAPPIATFRDEAGGATEANLANGLALSVECDRQPEAARARLEHLLGPATVVVASGGEWPHPDTGEIQSKLHLHWRLTEPTRTGEEHAKLKRARALAAALVGGDATNVTIVHPIRWPGSWHRKRQPRLERIAVLCPEREIELSDALELLQEAVDAEPVPSRSPPNIASTTSASGEVRDTAQLVTAVVTGDDFHAPIVALAMRFQRAGMPEHQSRLVLQGLMRAVPADRRESKDGAHQPGRWQARYDDIGRAVSTARDKLGAAAKDEPLLDVSRFRLDLMTAGSPPERQFLLAPYIPLGTTGLLVAAGGTGNAITALDLCLAVAWRAVTPHPDALPGPLGGTIPPEAGGASVFVTLEDDTPEIHRRAQSLDPKRSRDGLPCYVVPGLDIPEFDPALVTANGRAAALTGFANEGLDRLLENIARASGHPVRLLVLDPAGDFLNADENDALFVKPLMRRLREIAARHGCTVLLLGHVAKAVDADGPSMRGSSAWVANSRFALSMWRPAADEAGRLADKVGAAADALVWASLLKANHAGAPVGKRRLLARDAASGRLQDITARQGAASELGEEALIATLVDSCRDYAEAGLPFSCTGVSGLWNGRADLPPALANLSKRRLEALGNAALEAGRLVKARTTLSQGAPKYLDVPDGPLSRGVEVRLFQGSRREALARLQRGARGYDRLPEAFPADAFPWEALPTGNRECRRKAGVQAFPAERIPTRPGTRKNRSKPPHSRIPGFLPYRGEAFSGMPPPTGREGA